MTPSPPDEALECGHVSRFRPPRSVTAAALSVNSGKRASLDSQGVLGDNYRNIGHQLQEC
eukprot:14321973-Alexandrium_andersonii.AAC.1